MRHAWQALCCCRSHSLLLHWLLLHWLLLHWLLLHWLLLHWLLLHWLLLHWLLLHWLLLHWLLLDWLLVGYKSCRSGLVGLGSLGGCDENDLCTGGAFPFLAFQARWQEYRVGTKWTGEVNICHQIE